MNHPYKNYALEIVGMSPEEILDSRQTVRVLQIITEEGESYPKEIAQELGTSSSSISNTVAKLRDRGILVRGKRTQAQYYRVAYGRLAEIWRIEISEAIEEFYEGREKPPLVDVWEENYSEAENLATEYFRSVFAWDLGAQPTLRQVMFDSLVHLLGTYIVNRNSDVPDYIHSIYFGAKLNSNLIFNYGEFGDMMDRYLGVDDIRKEEEKSFISLRAAGLGNLKSHLSRSNALRNRNKKPSKMLNDHRDKFESYFKENMERDIPKHPYKIYRNIRDSNDLSDEEIVALEILKGMYTEKWDSLRDQSREE